MKTNDHSFLRNPFPFIECDLEGKIVSINPASQALLNHWKVKVDQILPDSFLRVLQLAIRTEIKHEAEFSYEDKLGFFYAVYVKEDKRVYFYGFHVSQRQLLDKHM